jgi:hypothetical protein
MRRTRRWTYWTRVAQRNNPTSASVRRTRDVEREQGCDGLTGPGGLERKKSGGSRWASRGQLCRLRAPEGLPLGPEGTKVFLGAFREAFPDMETTIENQIAEGDKVVTPTRLGVLTKET